MKQFMLRRLQLNAMAKDRNGEKTNSSKARVEHKNNASKTAQC